MKDLNAIVGRRFGEKTAREWEAILIEAGIPCSCVYDYKEVFEDPHFLERGLLWELDHPVSGRIRQVGHPIKYSGIGMLPKEPPPLLGGDTEKILLNHIGYTREKLYRLRQDGVI
jgi:crotonobetainyl-CoA:carnitine CoA-transferase CaiB-like acyl-CoA transferase